MHAYISVTSLKEIVTEILRPVMERSVENRKQGDKLTIRIDDMVKNQNEMNRDLMVLKRSLKQVDQLSVAVQKQE